MSAKDKLRSFAEARELPQVMLPDGALSYGDARVLVLELDVLRMERDDADSEADALRVKLAESEQERVKLSISESAFADFSAMWEKRAKLWKRLAKRYQRQYRAEREANELISADRDRAVEDRDTAELERDQLQHELRKYQPSDGMMVKLLGLNDCIREAARIFDALLAHKIVFHDRFKEWLSHPTVVAARKFDKGGG